MARMQWLGFAFLGLTLVGCVPQEKYNASRLALEAAQERFATADAQAKAATAQADAYQRQLKAVMDGYGDKEGMLANLNNQVSSLQTANADLERRLTESLNTKGEVVVLPAEVNTALTDFANQNPDLVDFDSSKGVVKFKSDVTFNTGSADLRAEVRTAIARFAQILNSPAASTYELQVAGHTDSQRVSNPATVKAGHKDNWYLSSHRAISVGTELQSQRVNPQRIAVVGYADQHPIASNGSEQGRAQNRRVEVLILPSAVRNAVAAGATEMPAAPGRPAPAKANVNKDTTTGANVDRGPAFNK